MRCPNPNFVWPKGKIISVPCGKCLACLSNKRVDWSTRLMQEYKVSSSAHFVTLTYSQKMLPDYGVSKRHLQLYFKRLRKTCTKLRYYAVGEYGTKTNRPHYHAIVFNCNEKQIRDAWSFLDKSTGKRFEIGLVHIGSVTEASVSYCLKYIVQSKDAAVDPYSGMPINRGFALMSRGYGLGINYLSDEMLLWHRSATRVYMMHHNEKHRLPRFYKDKIWPDSSWSNWAYRREQMSKKTQSEADAREKKEIALLKKKGYSPEQMQKFRNAALSRIKQKVAYNQTL